MYNGSGGISIPKEQGNSLLQSTTEYSEQTENSYFAVITQDYLGNIFKFLKNYLLFTKLPIGC
jgi:hypothetical protein